MELGSLTTISGGAIWVESDGTGSVLDAPALTSATGGMEGGYQHGFQASDGGTLKLPVMASCTVETITVQGASLSLPDLSDIDGSSITVSAGSHLTLPAVTSYTGATTNAQTIEATGTGSELSLPALTTITGGGNGGNSYAQFEALSGGDVELGSLTTISGGAIWVESDGTGSVLDAPALTSATGGMEGGYQHGFQASDGGTLKLPAMASCTVETITVQGASLSLPDLSDIDGSSITVSAGSHLTLPAVTSYTGATTNAKTIEATGTGSELSLPALTTITGGGNGGNSYAQFEALSGGDVELGSLTTISGGAIWVESDGTGSVLDARR